MPSSLRRNPRAPLALLALLACGDDGNEDADTLGPTTPTLPQTDATAPGTGTTDGLPTGDTPPGGTDSATGTGGSGTTAGPVVTTGPDDTGETASTGTTGSLDMCKVSDDMDAVAPCLDVAPPDSFEPDIQWAWPGQDGDTQIVATPVVANLTDDNGDGEIDLCDVPDIVVHAYPGPTFLNYVGNLYVLDGATGAVHYKVADVSSTTSPAIADIDGDGLPEILTGRITDTGNQTGNLVALEHDGTQKWASSTVYSLYGAAIAVADIDHDGDGEIVHHGDVFDHTGALLWSAPASQEAYVNTIADLDGDDNMEIILGPTAYRHDGTPYYALDINHGHPQVADLDADGLPEVLVVTEFGLALIEHDGTLTYSNQTTADWQPAAIHDFDGDMQPEIAVGSGIAYSVLETDLTAKWTATIQDGSGFASSTAFDFLGDGTAEAMYADEVALFIFGDAGQVLMNTPRGSITQWELPIVVDVDNDASAEIVVVSNLGYNVSTAPPLQVVRDKMDRWIPARRIWNQHTYHVTNVREDATIPQYEPRSWQQLNTFRTQAQIASGGICQPIP
jgi:hypothetical protein